MGFSELPTDAVFSPERVGVEMLVSVFLPQGTVIVHPHKNTATLITRRGFTKW
jgi:hypothetical protein